MNKAPLNRDYLWENLLERVSHDGFFEKNGHLFSRRAMLVKFFNGIGALGLAAALGQRASGGGLSSSGAVGSPASPLPPKLPNFAARAKGVIHL